MLQDSILIWKLLSILFFSILGIFLLYSLLEQFFVKLEFKKNLKLVKEQLLFDIFKDYNSSIASDLILDEFSKTELDIRLELSQLKKIIYCDLSKYDLGDLEHKVHESMKEKEKKLNKLILNRYRDAIRLLNKKMILLRTELDAFKKIFYDKVDNYLKSEKINLSNELKHNLEEFIHIRVWDIVDQKLKEKTKKIDEHFFSLVSDRDTLYNYISLLKKQNDIQKHRNRIFVLAIITLFVLFIILIILVFTESPLLFSIN